MSFFLLDKSPSWNTWNLTSRTRFASTFFILYPLDYRRSLGTHSCIVVVLSGTLSGAGLGRP